MTQIVDDSVAAFCEGRDFRRSNMEVSVSADYVNMWHHGNLIAVRSLHEGLYDTVIGNAGWWSVTTKARLDALLHRITMGAWGITGRTAPAYCVGEWTLYSRKHGEHPPFTGCVAVQDLIDLDTTIAREREARL